VGQQERKTCRQENFESSRPRLWSRPSARRPVSGAGNWQNVAPDHVSRHTMLLIPQSFTHPTDATTFRYHLAVRAVVADMRRYSTPCYSSISIGVVWRSWMLPHQLLFESIQKGRPEDVDKKVSQPQERPTSKTWKRSREKAERALTSKRTAAWRRVGT
jgi:hypothetical protein